MSKKSCILLCLSEGTGNVLKIQHLLHTCSEYHGNKEDEGAEEGLESDAASPKENSGGAGGATSEGGDTAKTKKADSTVKKSTVATGTKDVEMKDVEASELGSLSEPGAHQAVSVLGIALIAMGEEIGAEMALRTFNHLVKGYHSCAIIYNYLYHAFFFKYIHMI